MLVAWREDEKGNITGVYGIFKEDAEVVKATMNDLAVDMIVKVGDIKPVPIVYTPANATLKR